MLHIIGKENYDSGRIIFEEGSSGDLVYVLETGVVEISKKLDGKECIIETLKPGEIFGETGFIADMGRIATARAIGAVTVGIIDREFLDSEFMKLSKDFRHILISLAHRVKRMTGKVNSFTTRQSKRVKVMLPVTFRFKEKLVKAYIGNISTWGFFIILDDPLNPGHRFSMKLNLPDLAKPVKVNCEVVWARKKGPESKGKPPGMGIKFTDMEECDYELLKEYLVNQTQDKGDIDK